MVATLTHPSTPWFIYLIKTNINTYYCGVTTDLSRRFNEHQSESKRCAKYLRGKHPLTLAWSCQCPDKQQAMQLEYRIKQLPRIKKLRIISEQSNLNQLIDQITNTH